MEKNTIKSELNALPARILNLSPIFLIPLLSSCGGQTSEESSKKMNVVVFFSDELDHSYLSCYEGDYQTPNIDNLAAKGMRFTNAYSAAAMCTPSRFAFLTGQYPGRCKAPEFLKKYPEDEPYSIAWNTYLHNDAQSLARIFSSAGYQTGISGKWHLGPPATNKDLPALEADADLDDPITNKKLEAFQDTLIKWVKRDAGFDYAASIVWDNNDHFPVKRLANHHFEWITKGATDFIDLNKENPFFLYITTTSIHGPHYAPSLDMDVKYTQGGIKPEIKRFPAIQKLKDEGNRDFVTLGMAYLDEHVRTVMEKLEAENLLDNTIILFIPDHNREPGKSTCYQKGIQIPMIAYWPGITSAGSVSNAMIQTIDLVPTLLSGLNINEENLLFDGRNMLEVLKQPNTLLRDYIYIESGFTRGITDGTYKYIAFRYPQSIIEDMKSGKLEYAPNHVNMHMQQQAHIAMDNYPAYFDHDQLYDLEKDPYEQENVYGNPEYRKEQKRLVSELTKHLEHFDHLFDLSDTLFQNSESFKKLAAKTLAIGTEHISWYNSEEFEWPPKGN